MKKTTVDLVRKFNATTGYTISDEISLIFPAVMMEMPESQTEQMNASNNKKQKTTIKVHSFNGRVEKIASVTASYASVRFNYHLSNPASQWDDMPEPLRKKMMSYEAHFDGRVIPVPDHQTAMDCIFWYTHIYRRRCNFDGFRNAISQISINQYGQKKMHGKSCEASLDMLAQDGIHVFTAFPLSSLFGTFVKREQFQLFNAVNPKTKLPVANAVMRTHIRTGSFNWAEWNAEDKTEFLMAKLWPQINAPPKDEETFSISA